MTTLWFLAGLASGLAVAWACSEWLNATQAGLIEGEST